MTEGQGQKQDRVMMRDAGKKEGACLLSAAVGKMPRLMPVGFIGELEK